MKSHRLSLTVALILITVAAMSIASTAADTQKSQSDAQKSFDNLKMLAGEWEGSVTLDPPQGTGEKYDAVQRYTCKASANSIATIAVTTEMKTQPDTASDRVPLLQKLVQGEVVCRGRQGSQPLAQRVGVDQLQQAAGNDEHRGHGGPQRPQTQHECI